VEAAQAAGLVRDADRAALCDELIGAVVERVRPARPNGHGTAWDALTARRADITGWVKGGKTLVKIEDLLARSGTRVPYRTLHRFATAECGFRPRRTTVRVLDGDPGAECQIDFAQMGFITDVDTGRRRKVHALILTAVFSRHMFVHLTYGQTLADVIAGCEAAWSYFGGVYRVLIPEYVPRNIFRLMYPARICAQRPPHVRRLPAARGFSALGSYR
jgi:transposase